MEGNLKGNKMKKVSIIVGVCIATVLCLAGIATASYNYFCDNNKETVQTFANNEELVTKHLKLQIQHIEGGTIELLEVAESDLNVRYSLDEMPEDDEDGTDA